MSAVDAPDPLFELEVSAAHPGILAKTDSNDRKRSSTEKAGEIEVGESEYGMLSRFL